MQLDHQQQRWHSRRASPPWLTPDLFTALGAGNVGDGKAETTDHFCGTAAELIPDSRRHVLIDTPSRIPTPVPFLPVNPHAQPTRVRISSKSEWLHW